MGGTTSTQAGSIDTDSKVTENSNFGLLNISNESLTGGINVLEIITFIIVCLATFYFLKIFCARHRKKRLAKMQQHLQGISIQHDPQGPPAPPVVHPAAARVQIVPMSLSPPIYQGDQLGSAGRAMMEKYDILAQPRP